jgi:hypothetical protein
MHVYIGECVKINSWIKCVYIYIQNSIHLSLCIYTCIYTTRTHILHT